MVVEGASLVSGKTFAIADCQQHTTEKDCWLIIGGKVYDVTDFLDEHPGGFDIILSATGKPCSGRTNTECVLQQLHPPHSACRNS